MKMTRIEIEGKAGRAFVKRNQDLIQADIESLPEGHIVRNANPTNAQSCYLLAAILQNRCDGYQGTVGDIQDYLRVVQTFAD